MPPLNGDRRVLDAARVVLLRDPRATMAAVARQAGMGVGGLYRRFGSKQDLLRAVCDDNLRRYVALGEAAIADSDDPWTALAQFLRNVVDDGIHQLTPCLAGVVPLDDGLTELAEQADDVTERLLRSARGSGVLRADVSRADLTLLVEQLGSLDLGSERRTAELRHRYLSLILDGLRADAASHRLPGPAPQDGELALRWKT
ncbi:helix-turn-helix domain-containing protein [Nocardioides sp. KR10-350]|uniref:TetR/AcrR family transcriptional regulator n=1 Tax=Nocardioides cheoyonin TaxID=3156615 RepID=UPI0032B4B422